MSTKESFIYQQQGHDSACSHYPQGPTNVWWRRWRFHPLRRPLHRRRQWSLCGDRMDLWDRNLARLARPQLGNLCRSWAGSAPVPVGLADLNRTWEDTWCICPTCPKGSASITEYSYRSSSRSRWDPWSVRWKRAVPRWHSVPWAWYPCWLMTGLGVWVILPNILEMMIIIMQINI